MNLLTFKYGIHPAYKKNSTEASAISPAKIPKKVVIPLQQHIGAPNKPLVKKGDTVKTGQKIAESEAFVSSPVHASISGKIKAIASSLSSSGQLLTSVTIASDGKDEAYESSPKKREYTDLSPDEIRAIAKEAGIVGLGGAAFPTHVKLNPPKEKKIDAVIINGSECEPYLTADHRIMLEQPEKVIYGLKAIMKSLNVSKGYIGIENNKKDAIEALLKVANKNGADIEINGLHVKYPQGAEKMLIKAILDREVPTGGLPMDVGVVVQNAGTAVALTEAIQDEKPVIERVVTVSGSG
ncbi:MAG: RnfABCDGE type electron transport complex subunit C, partial [Nitrospinota bacterium]|nr:RnfABCDGE type electron transport complex subunit C [Nitrospinota bacterium]